MGSPLITSPYAAAGSQDQQLGRTPRQSTPGHGNPRDLPFAHAQQLQQRDVGPQCNDDVLRRSAGARLIASAVIATSP